MGKLLSWVAIAFAIYVAYKVVMALQRKAQLRQSAESDPKAKDTSRKSSEPGQLTTLIACAHCGLQLPKGEAVSANDHFFCGEAHARRGVKNSGEA